MSMLRLLSQLWGLPDENIVGFFALYGVTSPCFLNVFAMCTEQHAHYLEECRNRSSFCDLVQDLSYHMYCTRA